MPKHTILFLAANPHGTSQLRLGEECAEIQRELKMAPHRNDFRFESRWAVSIDELMRHLMEIDPTVIHFSGHGGGSAGLLFQDEHGRRQPVSATALAMMVETAARSPRVVVLNACYSTTQAEALRSKVDCVVGMDGAIGDEAARTFAARFYGALGNRRSVGNAVAQGVAVLAAKQFPDELLPRCATRNGIEANEVFLEPFAASPGSFEAPGTGASDVLSPRIRDVTNARRVARKLGVRHRFLEISYELHTAFVEATKLKKGRQLLSGRLSAAIEDSAATATAAGDEIASRLREFVVTPPLDVRITIEADRRVHFDPKTAWASYYAFPWVAGPALDVNGLLRLRETQYVWRLTPHVDRIPEAPFEWPYDAMSTYLEVRHDGYRPEFVPLRHLQPRTFEVRILPVLHKRIAILEFPCEHPDSDVSSLSQLIAQGIAGAIEARPELATFGYFSDTLRDASSMDFLEKIGRPPIEMGNEVLTLRDVQAMQAELASVDTCMVSGEGRHILRKALDIQFLVRGSYRIFDHEDA